MLVVGRGVAVGAESNNSTKAPPLIVLTLTCRLMGVDKYLLGPHPSQLELPETKLPLTW